MNQLYYNDEIKRRHLQYYLKYILPDICMPASAHYTFTNTLAADFLNELGFSESQNILNAELINEQIELFTFIKDNIEDFAIGTPHKIRELCTQIENQFILITRILSSNKPDATAFKEFLYGIFGYANFKMKSIYSCYYSLALKETKSTRYSQTVKQKIIDLVIQDYPELSFSKSQLESDEFKTASKFKKKFINITEVVCSQKNFSTLNVYKSFWNDYILVMSGNITVCPYCNRQYISPFLSDQGRVRADLDHFFSKKRYPYFSMSLYNLIPSCKQCNQSLKGSKELSFEGLHPFEHELHSYFRFILKKTFSNEIEIDIDIEEAVLTQTNINEYIDMFKLKHLYNYHLNQAQDLIKKRKMYSEDYLKNLYDQKITGIKHSFNSIEDMKSFIVGYPIDPFKINYEVLSKFKRDIAIQLGFQDDNSLFYNSIGNDLINQLDKINFDS